MLWQEEYTEEPLSIISTNEQICPTLPKINRKGKLLYLSGTKAFDKAWLDEKLHALCKEVLQHTIY